MEDKVNVRDIINKIGGRKFLSWVVAIALSTVMLGLSWIENNQWKEILIWITSVFIGGNVARKFSKSEPTRPSSQ